MHILKYFAYGHLPDPLRSLSMRFYQMAQYLATSLPEGVEKTNALRKLLEAKDSAVRTLAVDGNIKNREED